MALTLSPVIGRLGGKTRELTVTTTAQTVTIPRGEHQIIVVAHTTSAMGQIDSTSRVGAAFQKVTGPTAISVRVYLGTGTAWIIPL